MMIFKNTICLLFIFCVALKINAQQTIITAGTILFEKKVNMHKMMESRAGNGGGGDWVEMAKKNMPKYSIINYDLQFTTTQSAFKKSKTQPPADMKMGGMRGGGMMGMRGDDEDKNITIKNLESKQLIATKQIFEKLVLLKDSLPQIEWKITNEFKKIADINCRKATAIVLDSIFVVAFYADDIICNSGPESFNGLPGMILGLALPRLHTTYFATSITPNATQVLDAMPTKGEEMNYKKLVEQLTKATNDMGKRWRGNILFKYLL